MAKQSSMKTPADRAAEAIEAAELLSIKRMGATLNLSPAAKEALILTIAVAIQAALAEQARKIYGCSNLTGA